MAKESTAHHNGPEFKGSDLRAPSGLLGSEYSHAEFSHYRFVESLAQRLAQGGSGAVVEQLDALAMNEPQRAAICLTDLYAYCTPLEVWGGSMKEIDARKEQGERVLALMKEVVGRLGDRSNILSELAELPTVDAFRFRRNVLEQPVSKSGSLLSAAVLRVSRNSELSHIVLNGYLSSADTQKLHEQALALADKRFLPVADQPPLSARNEALLNRFHELVQRDSLFPVNKYGYSGIAKRLERAGDAGGFVQVSIPWGASFDVPNPACHQCNDSALAARSYLSAHGVPADVWVATIGSAVHTVTIAYFKEGPRFTPVVVDASPYGGRYSVQDPNGKGHLHLSNPAGLQELRAVRSKPMPFMSGDARGSHEPNGLLPWFSEDLPGKHGRIIAMAGVQANQKRAGFIPERGTPEFRGEGVRHPKVVLEMTLFPGLGSSSVRDSGEACGTILVTRKRSGKLKVLAAHSHLSVKQIERMLEVAQERFSRIDNTVRRLRIDLSKRAFKDRR